MTENENPGPLKARLHNESIEKLFQLPSLEKFKEKSSSSQGEKKHPVLNLTLAFKIPLLLIIAACLAWGIFKFANRLLKPNPSQQLVYLRSPCPDFIGREEYLDTLYKNLITKWERSSVCIQGLWGKGGFGKTELAIEFANRFRSHFAMIWTVHCDNEESLRQGFEDLAKQLGLYQPSDKPLKTQEKVQFYLENANFKKPWLLIFDNVEDKIPDYPQRGGAILFTSQKKILNPQHLLEIRPFSEEESIQLFEKITGEERNSSMEKLSQELEEIPLLINHAAHYIKSTPGCSIADYQNLFCRHLFEKAGPLWKKMDVNHRYLKSLASSWQFSLKALEKENPLALDWLYVCSYLYPENIPETWIDDWLAEQNINLGKPLDIQRKEILQALQNYGLIHFQDVTRTFSFHRFFLYMIRESRQRETQADLYKTYHLLSKYNKVYNFFQMVSWEAANSWYLHAYEFTKWIDKYSDYFSNPISLQKKIDLFSALGLWNLFNDHSSAALQYFYQTIALVKNSSNTIPSGYIQAYFSSCIGIGYSHFKVGQYRQALNFLQRYEPEFLKFQNENPLELSALYIVKGLCHEELREHEISLLCYQKSLEFTQNYPGDKRIEGLCSVDTMRLCAFGNMGQSLMNLGRFEESLKFFNQALLLGENTCGKNHPLYLMYAIERAQAILNKGDAEKALKMMNDSINQFLNLNHLPYELLDDFGELGFSWYSLGNAYLHLNLSKKAKEMFKRAHRTGSRNLGKKSFPIVRSYLGMGLAYLKEKNVKKGFKYLLKRLQLYIDYEVTPQQMAPLFEEFEQILHQTFQIPGSKPYIFEASQKAARLSEKSLGKDHPLTSHFLNISDQQLHQSND